MVLLYLNTNAVLGDGPKNCIGLRFSMLQIRIGLVKLLGNFEFSVSSKTQYPIKYNKRKFVLSPEEGMWLEVSKVSQ